ncbi:NAD(P)-dependent oxidoreductase [Synechococcus sp. CCY9201]|uniref:NAD(P)-dependent oxidoreductase n=1 Tax=Synechococcus sp. CCY9201 TaxID=174697 RepID=UPI002B20E272|nr:NAD(P)-dependent oxidoreductase [Synechococcus sp. CCY9201]
MAFLGLGQLGTPMVTNLLAAGFPLTVHNRTRKAEEPLAAAGAARGCSPADAAATAEILCLCLTDGAAVEDVLFGPQGAAAALPAGGLVIDFSTIDPSQAQACHDRLRPLGLDLVDAPVTGGTEGAKAGTLSVLVGGAEASVHRAMPLLQTVGKTVTHFGPIGAGQQVKAVNQVLVAGSYAAVAEAMALGQRLGLPMEMVRQALCGGAAGSWALEHRAATMLRGDYPLGFKLSLHRKDLTIALAAARAVGLSLPLSERVSHLEEELIAAGHGDDDVSCLMRWFQA